MKINQLPLKNLSIRELFFSSEKCTYEIPIYQRNYAWGKNEISVLLQDIHDAFRSDRKAYYIGTLVTYNRGKNVFEVIDGQQRLTTLYIILKSLSNELIKNQLTYSSRKKSDDTLRLMESQTKDDLDFDRLRNRDYGIESGYKNAREKIQTLGIDKTEFKKYILENVRIIHYEVPRDIDLNHYFEVMNSRGEQLEKAEVFKFYIIEQFENSDADKQTIDSIWEACSQMNSYVQYNMNSKFATQIFGNDFRYFLLSDYDEIKDLIFEKEKVVRNCSINEIIQNSIGDLSEDRKNNRNNVFQAIIDFPNFLLIVLKYTLLEEGVETDGFVLDDKDLLIEYKKAEMTPEKCKKFMFNLLKARFILDNWIIHHSLEDDTSSSNPWKLQMWTNKDDGQAKNLCANSDLQELLVQQLSMFEVAYSIRQRKNYLFYCMNYLMKVNLDSLNYEILKEYSSFLDLMADKYFFNLYIDSTKLNKNNRPIPRSFDEVMLDNNGFNTQSIQKRSAKDFIDIYGDGSSDNATANIAMYIFNYLDYKIWRKYYDELRGKAYDKTKPERKYFFECLGCQDFNLDFFDDFYFSRTRNSLEHFYSQSKATGTGDALNQYIINCFGNFAFISSESNSSGSAWDPKTKLTHYNDTKYKGVSVASIKFKIMMQICESNDQWGEIEIKKHQNKMLGILFGAEC